MGDSSTRNDPPASSANTTADGLDSTLREFERLVAGLAQPSFLFRLYVSGASSRSAVAIANIRAICDRYLPGHYDLEVIDIYQQPAQQKRRRSWPLQR